MDTLTTRQPKIYQSRLNSFYKLVSLLCLFLSSIQANGAEIRGRIIDAQSGQPIRNAKVFVSPAEMETQSNKDGKFILSGIPKSEVEITISVIGWPKLNFKKRLNQDLTDLGLITLLAEVIKLDEILVKASPNQIHQSLSSLHLGPNENQLLDSNLADSLSDLPGLAKGAIGPHATRPVLRGYSGDRFKITEGGITLGDLSQTSVDHAVGVDMANVERVEIVRGPKSLIFGSNTIGGVIDISKRSYSHKQINRPYYSSKAGYQSVNNGMFGTFHLQVPFDNKQVQFYSLKRKTGNLKTPIAQLHNTGLDKYELSAGIVGFSDQSDSNFSLNLLDMDYGIPGSKEGHINGARISSRQSKQRFHYHRNLSAQHFKELDIDQRNIHYVHSEFEATQPNASVNMNQKIFSLQGKLTGPKITAGTLLQLREFMTGGFYWTPDTREVNFALFSLFEREILDLIAQSSFRAEFLMIDPKTTSHRLSNMEYSEVIRRYFNTISASFQISKNWSDMETSILTMLTSIAN